MRAFATWAHGYDPGEPLVLGRTGRKGVKEADVPLVRIDILGRRPPEVIEDGRGGNVPAWLRGRGRTAAAVTAPYPHPRSR